jgi:hypothetical protein
VGGRQEVAAEAVAWAVLDPDAGRVCSIMPRATLRRLGSLHMQCCNFIRVGYPDSLVGQIRGHYKFTNVHLGSRLGARPAGPGWPLQLARNFDPPGQNTVKSEKHQESTRDISALLTQHLFCS